MPANACSLVMCILLTTASMVCCMVRLSVFAIVRRHTTRTPNGLTSTARFSVRDSIAPNAVPMAVAPFDVAAGGTPCQQEDDPRPPLDHVPRRRARHDE